MTMQAVHQFNWVDYAIFAIVGVSALISLFRGFIREAISLVAWVFGLFLALRYANDLQVYFKTWVGVESIRYFISFVSIFLVVVLSGLVINLIVGLLLKSSGLSFLDRFIGVGFGLMRGVAIVAVLLLLFTHFGTVRDSLALTHSELAGRFKPAVSWLGGFLPDKMQLMTGWVAHEKQAAKWGQSYLDKFKKR